MICKACQQGEPNLCYGSCDNNQEYQAKIRNSVITATRYVRKPLFVDAAQVTEENFEEMAMYCQGDIKPQGEGDHGSYIHVRVHSPKNPRQTKAFVGDWILYTDRGYKVYTDKAFQASFDLADAIEPRTAA